MINPSTVIITVFLGILTFVVSRKYFLLPFILGACFLPADQRIIIFDLDFTVLRILVVAGMLRLWLRGEIRSMSWNRFDRLILLWAVAGSVIYIVQWLDMRALVYKCGVLFDVIGLYWLFRQSIRSWHEIIFVFKVMALCAILLAPFVAFEWATGNNPFVVLGRVITYVREGRYRCQASFPHSIMLGLFWATLVPLFVGLAMTEKKKMLYWAATAASVFIVFATASSTPLGTLIAVGLLLPLFRYRCYGRQIVWAVCCLTVALHIVMKAPIWHLISRINLVGGSTGWHRYNLINEAINHFSEWAILGCRSTQHWGWGLQDITNQYVLEGVRGGLVTLVIFIMVLFLAVKQTIAFSLFPVPKTEQRLAWGICVAIVGHSISFIGVSYFGQIMMLLFLTFAFVGFIYDVSLRSNIEVVPDLVPLIG